MQFTPEQFNPTVAELQTLAENARKIVVTDFEDKNAIIEATKNRIVLKKARVQIEKRGKELREEAVAFSKAVIAKQNELTGIIEPEEERLAKIEADAEKYAIQKERERKLPMRKERLLLVGQIYLPSDSDINEMNDVSFETYVEACVNHKAGQELERQRQEQEAVRIEQQRRQAEIDAKEAELKRAEQQKERETELQKAREEARTEGERKAKEAELLRQAQAEAKAKADAEKLEKSKKYQTFLKDNGCTDETRHDFHIIETPTGYGLYKKVAELKK